MRLRFFRRWGGGLCRGLTGVPRMLGRGGDQWLGRWKGEGS